MTREPSEPAPAQGRALPRGVPIRFVKYYDKGSTDLSGHQISGALRTRGWDARTIYARELGALRGGIAVFIKTSRLDHLLLARLHRNRLALDVHDTVVFKRRIKNRWLYDALIFKSRRQLADFGRPGRLDRVILHQWDERYRPNRASRDRLSVAYLGEPRSFELWDRLPGVTCVRTPWFEAALDFNCHLSIRPPGREQLYKPNAKVATAAACEAVLITTPDASAVELLGEDYPFYCASDRESILAAVDLARAALGGPAWRLALERLAAVREATRMDRVLDRYEELFRDLVARGATAG